MNWLQLLLCLIIHAIRSLQTFSRTIDRFVSEPPSKLFRKRGAPPMVFAAFSGATGLMSGRVRGASDTLFPQNLFARIGTTFRYDYAIDAREVMPGEEHVFRATASASGAFRHQVAEFSGGSVLGLPTPTNARSRVEIAVRVKILELGDATPLAELGVALFESAFGEESSLGEGSNGLVQLPVVENVSVTQGVEVSFQPTGRNNVVIRVAVTILARATGESAEFVVAESAEDEWNGSLTGLMSIDVDNASYQVAIDPEGPCADVLG